MTKQIPGQMSLFDNETYEKGQKVTKNDEIMSDPDNIEAQSPQWSVYEHVFPNGKRYIGITKTEPGVRWGYKGYGYNSQPKIARAIQKYGWDNIQHNIIIQGLTEEQAKNTEQFFISELDAIDNGYNTDVGGGAVFSFYLDSFLLEMIRGMRGLQERQPVDIDGTPLWEYIYEDRKNRKHASNWNMLFREAVALYREEESFGRLPSATDDWDVAVFWGCFAYILEDFRRWCEGEERVPYVHAGQRIENAIKGKED